MKALGLLFIIAVVVEALIEYFEFLFDFIEDERAKKITKQLMALAISELFAFQLHALILTPLVESCGGSVAPWLDMVVAGIFCSRGANYLSDVVRLLYSVGSLVKAIMTGQDDEFWSMFEFENDTDDDEEEGEEDGTSTEENED